jgi:hypothetical protein
MGRSPRDVGLQPLENKALSRGIIGKSAPLLAEITIRKSQALAAHVIYNFSSLASGSAYHVGDVVNAAHGTIELKKFQRDDGTWTDMRVATVVTSTLAAGSATKELNLNNIMVRVIPDTPAVSATYKYADLGGNVNLGVHGGDPVAYGQKTALRPVGRVPPKAPTFLNRPSPSFGSQRRVCAGMPRFPCEPQGDRWEPMDTFER